MTLLSRSLSWAAAGVLATALLGCEIVDSSTVSISSSSGGGSGTVFTGSGPMITASGHLVRTNVPAAAVRSVSLQDIGALEITIGSPEQLTIEADDNIMPLVAHRVEGGNLTLALSGSCSNPHLRYLLTIADLESLSLDGSAQATALGLHAHTLTLTVDGAAQARIGGAAERTVVTLSGSGQVDAQGLAAAPTRAALDGASQLTMLACGPADFTLSGTAHLTAALADGAVTLRADGASHALLSGQAESAALQADGTAEADASALQVGTAAVTTDGCAKASIAVQSHLEASAGGASSIRYRGPATVGRHIDGVATITSW